MVVCRERQALQLRLAILWFVKCVLVLVMIRINSNSADVNEKKTLTLDEFASFLDDNLSEFHWSRTPETLRDQWCRLQRHYKDPFDQSLSLLFLHLITYLVLAIK